LRWLIRMRNSFAKSIMEFAQQDESVFLITGDAGYGVLCEYQKRYPDRYLNLGVAEQNMIGFAAGMALAGYNMFVYDIAPFVLYRCYEQVRNDICYQRLPITLIGVGSGVSYAPSGMTHYSIEDIAVARTMPNLVILSPSDPVEVRSSMEYALTGNSPVYIRIAKSGEPVIHEEKIDDITKPQVVRHGRDVAVLFHGSISKEVIEAADNCRYNPVVLSVPMVWPMDFDCLAESLGGVHTIITVEEHYVTGGLGTIIAEWITAKRLPIKLKKMGIPNKFIHDIKNAGGIRELYGFSSVGIRTTIEESFRNG